MATEVVPAIGSSRGRLASLQAMLAAHRALALDDLWTGLLGQLTATSRGNEPGSTEEIEGVRKVGEALQEAVETLASRARELRMMLDETADDAVNQALEAVLAASSEGTELRTALSEDLLSETLGGYEMRSAVIAACSYVEAQASEEQGLLAAKLDRLAAGDIEPGDFRFPFRCAAYLVLCGGGVALAVASGVGLPLVMGGVALETGRAIHGWKDGGCKQAWDDITGGRR